MCMCVCLCLFTDNKQSMGLVKQEEDLREKGKRSAGDRSGQEGKEEVGMETT